MTGTQTILLAGVVGLGGYVASLTWQGRPIEYMSYVAPGLLAYATFMTAIFQSLFGAFIRMRYQRTWEGQLTTQVELSHVVWGEVLWAGGGLVATTALLGRARAAENYPPIGTWPAGSSGPSVTIGITVPRTGTYAVQGEDELKGMMLAVEHLNSGDPVIKMISPHTKNGVLGKEVKYVVADSEAKPNVAVQEQSRFISENKIVMMTG